MNDQNSPSSAHILDCAALRKSVGIIGIALPFAILVGHALLEAPELLESLSRYYHTGVRNVFVGSLCAIGVFLFAYRGYNRREDLAGNLTCIFAIGVAFFPIEGAQSDHPDRAQLFEILHHVFGALLFVTLGWFCLVFRKTHKDRPMTKRKKSRNAVYGVCASIIFASLIGVAVFALIPDEHPIQRLRPTFWLEAFIIWSFGAAWFVKGEGLLKDRAQAG